VHIIVRGDSGFARNDIMTWCETTGGLRLQAAEERRCVLRSSAS
jgi:hypothetical protein